MFLFGVFFDDQPLGIHQYFQGLGMNKATDVLVSGMSAGGLATFLHVDAIASWLPQAKVFGVPDSGFFLDLPDVTVGVSLTAIPMYCGSDSSPAGCVPYAR